MKPTAAQFEAAGSAVSIVHSLKRQVPARIFLTLKALLLVCISLREPESLSYTLLHLGGAPARLCMLVLATLAAIALIDTVVNDIMPAAFVFRTGWRCRQRIWMLIAVTYAGQAWVVVHYGVGYWLAVVYAVDAAWCATVAFMDLHYEHLVNSQARRSTDPGARDA